MELCNLTIHEANRLLIEHQISSVELTDAVLRRLEQVEPRVRAFVTLTQEQALEQAREIDRRRAVGEEMGVLAGIPVAIKDVLCTQGVLTTCSSRMLENFLPPYDATVVTALKQAGAVIVGKTNMDEFAMGSSTENSAFYPTHNPWDLERVPGGSSGGSAAAVAAGEAIYSLGSDTGGSVRQPASLCGVVGLKPTYGLVSRFGLIAFASSLDQVGPLTRDVTDCALVMNAIAGYDSRDSTSAPIEVPDYTTALVPDIAGLKLGVPREYYGEGIDPAVRDTLEQALGVLEKLGAHVDRDVSLPSSKYSLAAYYLIAPSEASSNLARYDGVKYGYSVRDTESMWGDMFKTRERGFGAEVKRRIMLGTFALSAGYYDAYYAKAQKVRTLIKREFDQAFEKYDALVTPTSPTVAFKIGEKTSDPIQMYLSDICTVPINIAGITAISVPAGLVDGLPVGMQIIGKTFAESMVLRVAYAYEQATEWYRKRPSL
ncbi:MAG: Asp-tRNA(Asn)/Glu-tRNA(Gln) amidotransferase subunit GatA [Chloroflexota bacterium]|nr:MAG: Asp-tRNA(Asn)/Glu-tRNA(Gln) amidotransferase subunit GatA [Chloroflexota bacterium]